MLTYWFFIIPLLFFTIIFYFASRKYFITYEYNSEQLTIKNYLPFIPVSLYLFSAIALFMIELDWYPYSKSSYTLESFLIYSAFLTIFLIPTLFFKPLSPDTIIPDSKLISLFFIIMSVLGIFSLIYQFPAAVKSSMIGAADMRVLINNQNYSMFPNSPFTTLAVGISYFYLFYIAFFFISIIQERSFILRLSLLLGSLSYIISGLAFTTRDVFIFYSLGFIFTYYFFINLLPKLTAKRIKLLFTFFGLLFLSAVLIISSQRFSSRVNTGIMYGTIGYIAHQPLAFSETINKQTKFYEGNLRFPIFKAIYSEVKKIKYTQVYQWSFGTFIKDFYSTGGFIFLIFMTILIVPFFYFKLRRVTTGNVFRDMILSLIYYQFITQGIFYFKMGNRAGNLYIIIMIFLYFITYFTIGKTNNNNFSKDSLK